MTVWESGDKILLITMFDLFSKKTAIDFNNYKTPNIKYENKNRGSCSAT